MSAVSIAAAVAQTVYSVNAVGYVNVTVPAGKFAMLANPLNVGTNGLTDVLPSVPVNTKVFVFNTATGGFDAATLRATGWTGTGASATLAPGAGFFVQNVGTTDMTITFVGEVPQGTNLVVNIPVGFSVLGSIVPQAGKLVTDLKFPSATNDKFFSFNTSTQAYDPTLTLRATGWTGGAGEPAINVAQGFFYQAVAKGTWTRNFTVNQ